MGLNSSSAIVSGKTTQILGWGWGQGGSRMGMGTRRFKSEWCGLSQHLSKGQMPAPALCRTSSDEKRATAGCWQPSAHGTPCWGSQTRPGWPLFPQFSHTGLKFTEGSGHELNVTTPGRGRHFAVLKSSKMGEGRTCVEPVRIRLCTWSRGLCFLFFNV